MKVYVTKYALTKGILRQEVCKCNLHSIVRDSLTDNYYHGDEWHKTYEAALEKAEDMRQKKIISLQKQISKLGKLDFTKERDK